MMFRSSYSMRMFTSIIEISLRAAEQNVGIFIKLNICISDIVVTLGGREVLTQFIQPSSTVTIYNSSLRTLVSPTCMSERMEHKEFP